MAVTVAQCNEMKGKYSVIVAILVFLCSALVALWYEMVKVERTHFDSDFDELMPFSLIENNFSFHNLSSFGTDPVDNTLVQLKTRYQIYNTSEYIDEVSSEYIDEVSKPVKLFEKNVSYHNFGISGFDNTSIQPNQIENNTLTYLVQDTATDITKGLAGSLQDNYSESESKVQLLGNISNESSMSTSKPENTSFEANDWENLPNFVCMQNAEAFTTKEVIEKGISDGVMYRFDVKPPSGPIIWRSGLLLAWFTCEGNLYHFMTETLHPIVYTLNAINFEEPPLLGIVASASMNRWKANETGCHGGTYYPLFSAFNVDPVMFSFPNPHHPASDHTELDDAGCAYPGPSERWQLSKTYCFKETHQILIPGAWSPAVVPRLLAWAGCAEGPSSGVRVAIVQRRRSRRILNVGDLVQAAAPLVAAVSVVYLEDMSLQEQIRSTACGGVILAGVQGAGLQWATLMGQDGARAGLIEWVWRYWDTLYAGTVGGSARGIARTIEDANVHEPCPVPRGAGCCCPGSDAACAPGECAYPTKNVDIVVDLEAWRQDLQELIAHIRASP